VGDALKICAKCLLPEGKSGITVSADDACNLCHYHDAQPELFPKAEERVAALNERFALFKGRYKYDALVGLSGGKDSTYVLYQLVRKYGLNVLAVTFDNGFLTASARQSAANIAYNLGVEHLFVPAIEPAMKLFYKQALKKHGWPCIPCFVSSHFLALNYCTDHQIPFYVTGRSPYQLLRNFGESSHDPSIELIHINLQPHSFKRLYRFYSKLKWIHRLWMLWLFFPNCRAGRTVARDLLREPKFRKDFSPEILNYFLFEPYDEDAMKCFLEAQRIGYQRPSHDVILGHGDCQIHEAATPIYQSKTATSMIALELAVMLRKKIIDREQAQQILCQSVVPPEELLENSINHFCDYFDLSRQNYEELLCRLEKVNAKSFWGH
jgi:hypothetical protein